MATTTAVAMMLAPLKQTPSAKLNTFDLIDMAWLNGEIDIDHAAAFKVWALFGDRYNLPERFVSTVPVQGDGTMLFLSALQNWQLLSPATQKTINDFITPRDFTVLPPGLTPTLTPTLSAQVPLGRYATTIVSQDHAATAMPIDGRWEMEIMRGLERLYFNGKLVLTQMYQQGEGQISVVDSYGSLACPEIEQTGKYTWSFQANMLVLKKIDDPCFDRAQLLQGRSWIKQ